MDSVVVSKPGVFLGKTSERLVVRGPRPRVDFVDGEPQLTLPFSVPAPPSLSVVTSDGTRKPPQPLRRLGEGAQRAKQEQIELSLFRISEIIVTGSGVTLSTDLIEECCERGIRLAFLRPNGQPFAMISSPMLTATVVTRRAQMAAYGDERGATIARTFVKGKLGNQAALLKYFGKYKKAIAPGDFEMLAGVVRSIVALRRDVDRAAGATVDELRGALLAIEGSAGRHYWNGVRTLLAGHASFDAREHRGAVDPVNAALNYGYGVLYSQIWGAVMNAGLEPFAGFLHVDRPGKPSLVLDLIEEFRQPIVDRAIIALLTKGGDMAMRGGLLTDESRRLVAGAVLERLEGEATLRGRRYRVKSIVQIQARSLATMLRGGAPYRPFAFKW